jgi:hypothetical protein
MTQDEIIEMARQAGGIDIESHGWTTWVGTQSTEFLERFANLVAAKATEEANARANASWTLMCKKMVAIEREACAKVCDEVSEHPSLTPQHCAESIRARGTE